MVKALSTIFYTLFIGFIVAVAGLLVASMLPIPGNIEIKIVKSGSMEPSIPTGSIVVVKPQEVYRVGDVITFGEDTKTQIPTTHRIMEVAVGPSYITKGDANEENDPNPVVNRDVIGKVIFHAPSVGYVLDFAKQPIGFVLLVAIPAAFVILEEIVTIVRETRKGLRRRRGESDEDDNHSAELSQNEPDGMMVYARKRAMDEIFVPMMMVPTRLSEMATNAQHAVRADLYGMKTILTIALAFSTVGMTGIHGSTLAYFSDLEKSTANIFRAGEWVTEPEITPVLFLASVPDGEVLGENTDEQLPAESEENNIQPLEEKTTSTDTPDPIITEETVQDTPPEPTPEPPTEEQTSPTPEPAIEAPQEAPTATE